MRAKAPLSLVIALAVIIGGFLIYAEVSARQETKGIDTSAQTAEQPVGRDLPRPDPAAIMRTPSPQRIREGEASRRNARSRMWHKGSVNHRRSQ